MQRGKRTLHTNLVPVIESPKGKEGQRNAFIEERRDMMACRYYFHAVICRRLYEDCLNLLQKEFCITTDWATKELLTRTDFLQELKQNNTSVSDFKKEYDHFNWTVKAA